VVGLDLHGVGLDLLSKSLLLGCGRGEDLSLALPSGRNQGVPPGLQVG
jgi:hypothetical protein